MLQIVNNNKEFLTGQNILDTDKARKYQALLGWPSTSAFVTYVSKSLMTNYNITVEYKKQVEHIYLMPTHLLHGKKSNKN